MPTVTRTRFALPSLAIGLLTLVTACAATSWPDNAVALNERRAPNPGRSGDGTTALQDQPALQRAPKGKIIRGPSNITSFKPDEAGVAVDASTVDLRQVFEDIGPNATLWYQHVQTLANPYFEGRVNGSAGTERARDYMEFFFRLYGLEPAFPTGEADLGGASNEAWASYMQPFEFSAGRRMTVTAEGAHADIAGSSLIYEQDFAVLGNSGSGEVSGPITFVGYGISEGVDGYTSFDEDSDLDGRIAILLRYEPLDENGASQWADTRFSPNAGLTSKIRAVVRRDAAGIILVNPPGARDGKTGLETLQSSAGFGRELDIPVIQMSPEAADDLITSADPHHGNLMSWRRRADAGEVTTVDLSDDVIVSFGAELNRRRATQSVEAKNVGAVLRGRGRIADEWLVIGGHYDHNGYGNFGTTPDRGPLFPGADDNASGIAGMLLLAKMLSEQYAESDDNDLRSVLFLAFDAEERGLHGSRYYSRNPTIEPEKMTALLNMDMIGRLRSDNLNVLGVGSAHGFEDMLRPHFESSGLTVSVTNSGSGRSDDANFNRVNVPALHFFTGMHPEYTSPQDQAYTVNPVGGGKIMDLMYSIADDLVSRRDKLIHESLPGETIGQDRGYAPVRLGIRPGMGEDLETGILIEGVSEGTSAADGGIEAGDVMLMWNEVDLDSMSTLVEQLRAHKPGDVVTITVSRDGRRIELPVTLKASEASE